MRNPLFLLVLLFCSCSNSSEKQMRFGREVKKFSLKDFEVVQSKSEKWVFEDIYKPVYIGVTEDYILISDRATSQHLHLIAEKDQSYLGSFGERGDGPDEFLSFSNFTTSFGKNQVNFYSGNDRKLVYFTLKEGLTKPEVPLLLPDSISRIADINPDVLSMNMLDPERMLAKLINSDNKFVIQSLHTGEVLGRYDTWDGMLEVEDLPNSIMASVFQGKVAVSPNGKYFGYASLYWDLIEAYDTESHQWLRLAGPDQIEHKFSVDMSSGYPMHYYDTKENTRAYTALSFFGESVLICFV